MYLFNFFSSVKYCPFKWMYNYTIYRNLVQTYLFNKLLSTCLLISNLKGFYNVSTKKKENAYLFNELISNETYPIYEIYLVNF